MTEISELTIATLAEVYSIEVLEAKRAELLEKLEADMIVSASTGGGTSYTRQERIGMSDLIDAYTRAICLKKGQTAGELLENPSQVIDYKIIGTRY